MKLKETESNPENPYKNSLKGLKIADPVKSFFDWCIERENILLKRKSDEMPPWSLDSVFQKGRFLNVFREDDKGTKAVLRFAGLPKNNVPDLISPESPVPTGIGA